MTIRPRHNHHHCSENFPNHRPTASLRVTSQEPQQEKINKLLLLRPSKRCKKLQGQRRPPSPRSRPCGRERNTNRPRRRVARRSTRARWVGSGSARCRWFGMRRQWRCPLSLAQASAATGEKKRRALFLGGWRFLRSRVGGMKRSCWCRGRRVPLRVVGMAARTGTDSSR